MSAASNDWDAHLDMLDVADSVRRKAAWAEYERQKSLWQSAHPSASAQEHERAMREIAFGLGL